MTWEVDVHSDPCTQGTPITKGGRPSRTGLKSDANTEMKSLVSDESL